MNPYLYNAAYAGVEGHTVLYALYNNRWTNIAGSPQLSHVSFHTPLKGGIGIGAAAFNDTDGIISKNIGKVSGSYLFTIDREHHLRLGLSVGGGTQGINFGELDDPTDPAFQSITSNTSFMIADFGATYHFDHFNVGFSIPNLIGFDRFTGESFSPVRVKPLDNLMFKINYRGHITHDLAIEPHLIYRYSQFVPDQIEATVIFHIYHLVWAGATYRQNNTYAVTLGAKIKEKFAIGYGYEISDFQFAGLTGPSHEVHIGFHLGTKKEHAAHVSSFIKSHRLTPEQRATLAAKEREEKLQALQASRQEPTESSDELGIAGTSPNNDSDELGIAGSPVEKPSEETPPEKQWDVDETRKNATRTNPFGEKEKAIVIEKEQPNGEKIYAVAWEPIDEDWELINNEAPIQRQSSDGTSEIGVKYYRTNDDGEKQMIIKWEPVVTEAQVDELLKSSSTEEVIARQVAESAGETSTASPEEAATTEEEPKEETATVTERSVITPGNTEPVNQNQPDNPQQEINTEEKMTQDDQRNSQTSEREPEAVETMTEEVSQNSENQGKESTIGETAIPEVNKDAERAKGNEALTQDFRTHEEIANSDDHLEVKKGDNMLELPSGFYVIGGAFEEFQHAEDYSDQLFEKGYHEVIVGYLSARGYYYTVVSRHNSLAEANSAKARVKGRPGMSDVWVLKVND